jgi:hypothetical protein
MVTSYARTELPANRETVRCSQLLCCASWTNSVEQSSLCQTDGHSADTQIALAWSLEQATGSNSVLHESSLFL